MNLEIRPIDPNDPQALALLQASHDLMNSLFPAGSCHYLSVDALCEPHVDFVMAYLDSVGVGCAALAKMDEYGELKSMFVDEAARGAGVAHKLIEHIEELAKSDGLPIIRLETGEVLEAAVALYRKHGYSVCGPFGSYSEDPYSLFMEKALA